MPAKEKQRRPRREVQPFVDLLVSRMPKDANWTLGGSLRRGAPEVGDIDVMVVTPDGLFGDFRFPEGFTADRQGAQIANGFLARGADRMRCDFWTCKPEQAGTALMFITGPARLNIAQRAHAQKLGLVLSQYGLFRQDGSIIPLATEQDVYAYLELDWLTPAERQAWADKAPSGEKLTFPVQGSSAAYTVTVQGDYWSCRREDGQPCPAFKFSKSNPRTCKHIAEVQSW